MGLWGCGFVGLTGREMGMTCGGKFFTFKLSHEVTLPFPPISRRRIPVDSPIINPSTSYHHDHHAPFPPSRVPSILRPHTNPDRTYPSSFPALINPSPSPTSTSASSPPSSSLPLASFSPGAGVGSWTSTLARRWSILRSRAVSWDSMAVAVDSPLFGVR